jgi:hypothetical protein
MNWTWTGLFIFSASFQIPLKTVPQSVAAAHHFAGNGHYPHHSAPGAPSTASAQFAFATGGNSTPGGPRSGGGGHQQQHQQIGGVTNNNGAGPLNPRDFAAAQLVAQQQAVYEAAMVSS